MKERIDQRNDKYNQLIDRAQGVTDRIVNINSWCVNVSLALLGFHIALLLQLKFDDSDIVSFLTITPLVLLGISLIIGLILKLWFHAIDIAKEFIELNKDAVKSLDMPKALVDELNENDKIFEKIPGLKLERLPVLWIVIQVTLFLISLVLISIHLIKVLFV